MAAAAGRPSAQGERLPCGCPGSKVIDMREEARGGDAACSGRSGAGAAAPGADEAAVGRPSRLRQWPVQIHLVPPSAPYLKGADILIAADCVPFAYARFHQDLLAGKALVVGCPKLDDIRAYVEKLGRILASNDVRSVTVVRMEVPCCGGISAAARHGLAASGKDLPFRDVVVGVDGTIRG